MFTYSLKPAVLLAFSLRRFSNDCSGISCPVRRYACLISSRAVSSYKLSEPSMPMVREVAPLKKVFLCSSGLNCFQFGCMRLCDCCTLLLVVVLFYFSKSMSLVTLATWWYSVLLILWRLGSMTGKDLRRFILLLRSILGDLILLCAPTTLLVGLGFCIVLAPSILPIVGERRLLDSPDTKRTF